jgi:parvulin-like peptidyl-prolyl isomerase
MRSLVIFAMFAIGASAQNAAPAQNPPAAAPSAAPAATPAAPVTPGPVVPGGAPRLQPATQTPVAPDTVVANIDGHPYTAADVDKLLSDLPPQVQTMISRDPVNQLPKLLMLKHLEQQAEFHNLDKEAMWRQQLEMQRMQLLANAEITKHRNEEQVSPDQEHQYYEANKDKYRTAKVKVIYVSYNPNPAAIPTATSGKTRTQTEAKAKIDDLRKQALAGGDFGKLAKDNSEDKASAAKDGDFGEITATSPYPDPVKKAAFALKPGEISDPVQQPNGFYLFKCIEATQQPFEKVQQTVHNQLAQEDFNSWIKGIQARYQVKLENPAYFSTRTPK